MKIIVLFTIFISINSMSYAQRPMGPPPVEAFDACENKENGQNCILQTPHGQLSGSCKIPHGQFTLVCVPENERDQLDSEAMRGEENRRANNHPMRKHTVTQSSGIKRFLPAVSNANIIRYYEEKIEEKWRVIKSNGIPDHKVGRYPNTGNPNSISKQNFYIRIPAEPKLSSGVTNVKVPGWALNGVEFDPGAGEYYKGNRNSGWQYEALSGAIDLGIDENNAHVQPGGKYHYHGLPTRFLKRIGSFTGQSTPQVGWAADGFPIYALYGKKPKKQGQLYNDIIKVRSSYKLKSGKRPAGEGSPGGVFDGTFTADYEYVQGLGDLDECNGMMTVTDEYPNGTYAYFLTEEFPVVPRCLKGVLPKNDY